MNIFPASGDRESLFNLEELTERFRSPLNTDWSVAEAFLCLLLSAAVSDGVFSPEEQAEIYALAHRSRTLKALDAAQLAEANALINHRLEHRPQALQEACEILPADMRLSVFAHCVEIVLADGELLDAEAEFLNRLAKLLRLGEPEAKLVTEVLLIKNRF